MLHLIYRRKARSHFSLYLILFSLNLLFVFFIYLQ